jgi:hypothetical protein
VVKHRQLARQVGAFGAIAIKSSTDFNDMIFPLGSIFIFGSWVYEMDGKGNLHGHLVEAPEAHEDLTLPTKLTNDLEKLTVSEPTRALTTINLDLTSEPSSFSKSYPDSFKDKPSPFPIGLRNAASTLQEIGSNLLQVSSKKLGRFPTELNNMAKTYQNLLQGMARRTQKLHLTRAQEGLVLTVTPKDCLVHWPGTYPPNSNARLVEEAINLPYQNVVRSTMPTLQLKSSAATTRQASARPRSLHDPATTTDATNCTRC